MKLVLTREGENAPFTCKLAASSLTTTHFHRLTRAPEKFKEHANHPPLSVSPPAGRPRGSERIVSRPTLTSIAVFMCLNIKPVGDKALSYTSVGRTNGLSIINVTQWGSYESDMESLVSTVHTSKTVSNVNSEIISGKFVACIAGPCIRVGHQCQLFFTSPIHCLRQTSRQLSCSGGTPPIFFNQKSHVRQRLRLFQGFQPRQFRCPCHPSSQGLSTT